MVEGGLWFGHILRVNCDRRIPLEMSQYGGEEAERAQRVAAGTDVVVAKFCGWDTHQVPVHLAKDGPIFYIDRCYLSEGGADAAV